MHNAVEGAALRRLLQAACDTAVAYLETASARPVFPTPEAIANLGSFEEPLPEAGSDPETTLDLLHRIGSPATVVTTGGRYVGFVSVGVLPAAVAANWLAGAWDQNAGFWAMSPTASKLEEVAAAWLLELLDLPRDTAVGFVTGSTGPVSRRPRRSGPGSAPVAGAPGVWGGILGGPEEPGPERCGQPGGAELRLCPSLRGGA